MPKACLSPKSLSAFAGQSKIDEVRIAQPNHNRKQPQFRPKELFPGSCDYG